jgi:hypothetical protein
MAWGLIPVCTPQSGYINYPGIVNVPLGNVGAVVEVLQSLQSIDEMHLLSLQDQNWKALDDHFNWDQFAHQVIAAIESNDSPTVNFESLNRKLAIRWAEIRSPNFPYNPYHLATRVAGKFR